MKRHRKDLEINSAINVTNLLDTAFILLVAFMIVAPTLKSGLQVELPQVEETAGVPDESDDITITIYPKDVDSASDRLFLNGEKIRMSRLEELLQELYVKNPKAAININGDATAMYGTAIQALSIAQKVGFENFFFPASPTGGQPPADEEDR